MSRPCPPAPERSTAPGEVIDAIARNKGTPAADSLNQAHGGSTSSSPQTPRPQNGAWALLERDYLFKLITEQIPRFRSRPYVADDQALRLTLQSGLASWLQGDFCWSLCFDPAF
eukprot:7043081-Prymnesium_polylepis.1